jgi:hypothetical protein
MRQECPRLEDIADDERARHPCSGEETSTMRDGARRKIDAGDRCGTRTHQRQRVRPEMALQVRDAQADQ